MATTLISNKAKIAISRAAPRSLVPLPNVRLRFTNSLSIPTESIRRIQPLSPARELYKFRKLGLHVRLPRQNDEIDIHVTNVAGDAAAPCRGARLRSCGCVACVLKDRLRHTARKHGR